MKIGEWVWCHGKVQRVVGRGPLLGQSILSGGAGVFDSDVLIVTVADAFELAGHPVPPDHKVWFDNDDRSWMLIQPDRVFFDFADGWVRNIGQVASRHCLDLSRTPVADCYDALPQIVKEALK